MISTYPRAAASTAALLMLLAWASDGHAQTDWYNTDRGRPLRTEDAVAIERHAFELQLTPFAVTSAARRSEWEFEPELAWGFAPRTQLGVGVTLSGLRADGHSHATAASGVHVSVLHALNTETLGVPAFAVTGVVVIPAGGHRAPRTAAELAVVMTRTGAAARLHANARVRVADAGKRAGDTLAHHGAALPRWSGGIAVDRPLALNAILLAVELTADAPEGDGDVVWRSAAGVRVQSGTRLVLDAGVARVHSGPRPAWVVTAGSAVAFAIPALQARSAR